MPHRPLNVNVFGHIQPGKAGRAAPQRSGKSWKNLQAEAFIARLKAATLKAVALLGIAVVPNDRFFNKAIERSFPSSYQIAQSPGFM